MLVKLRVLEGPSAGRELQVNVAEFLIGRSEECQLRPKSDMVSRRHCSIVVGAEGAIIRDFGSRNGTLLNGERVEGQSALKQGDELKVGPLRFEVLIDHTLGGAKKPQVKSVSEAAQRTVATEKKKVDDNSVSDWLSEADDVDREHRLVSPETRQFRMDETDRVQVSSDNTVSPDGASEGGDTTETKTAEKKAPGKLPSRPEDKTKNSRDAAAMALKKLFKSQ